MDGSLRLLGSFQLFWRGAEQPVGVLAGRALLAYLALEADQPHSRELLATLFWPIKPRATGLTNLRQTITRLRNALPDLGAIVQIGEETLQLDLTAVQVDAVTFQRLLTAVATHKHIVLADCPACIDRLKEAVALYRSELLEGLFLAASPQFEEWLLLRREQLHQQALAALHTLTQTLHALGDYEGMRQYAVRQVELEPWRESAQLQLISALSFLGQREAALAQYESCRLVLQEELGVEPAPELRAMYERLRRDDHDDAATAAGQRHNLPLYLTPLVGRASDLAQLGAALQQPELRLLTLTGAGGMGKTRLALEVARAQVGQYKDGVYFVALAALGSAAALPSAIAAALGLRLGGTDVQAALFHALRDQQLLLLLDNFEHLISSAEFVSALLAAAPEIKLLVTSREQLSVRGEHVFVVAPLQYLPGPAQDTASLPAARLFVQVARRSAPGFDLSEENWRSVQLICRLTAGMPLALELAAAWVGTLAVAEIALEIAASADFLATELRDAPQRQHSLRAVFDWSWRLLSAEEQQALQQLSIFRGGFTREAALRVAGAALPILSRLLRKSLLRRSDGPALAGRYEMHELLRQFAAAYFAPDTDQRPAAEARHGEFYLGLVAAREGRLLHDEPRQASAEIGVDLDNVRQAWLWAVANVAVQPLLRCIHALVQFVWQAGLNAEWSVMADSATAQLRPYLAGLPSDAPQRHDAQALMSRLVAAQAMRLFNAGQYDQAFLLAQQALEHSQAGSSKEGETLALLHLGQILYRRGDYQEAHGWMQRALQLVQQYRAAQPEIDVLGNTEWVAQIWLNSLNTAQGNYEASAQHAVAALQLCRREKRLVGELTALINLTHISYLTRDLPAARRYGEQALQLVQVVGSRWEEMAISLELGEIARLQGEYDLALALTEQTLAVAHAINARPEVVVTTAYLARLHAYRGAIAAAREQLAQFGLLRLDSAALEDRAEALLAVAQTQLISGSAEQALQQAIEADNLAQQLDAPLRRAHALLVLGHAQAALGLSAAATSYSQALQLYRAQGKFALAAEPQAGLARLAFNAGDHLMARRHVDELLILLAQYPRAGLDEPFYIYRTCYLILQALFDERAAEVLQTAQCIFEEYAAGIASSTQRQDFRSYR